MKPHYEIQAITFTLLWKSKNTTSNSWVQREVQASILKGLGVDMQSGQVDDTELINRYKQGVLRIPEALKDAPFFLENYLVNEMFRENFPFEQSLPYEHYLRIIIRFGLVRFMMATQCATENELPSLKTLTQTVQSFCRRYQHDSKFAQSINTCFNNSGWSDLQKVYRFLKT
jgi:lysine-N-methylase